MQVATAGGEAALSWSVRDELLARVADLPGGAAVSERFQAVGATRPVELDPSGMRLVVEVVEAWMVEVGAARLPEGLSRLANELRNTVRVEMRDELREEFDGRRGSVSARTATAASCSPSGTGTQPTRPRSSR